MTHNDASSELGQQCAASWEKAKGTKYLFPMVSQRIDYISEVKKSVSKIGRNAELW